MLEQVGHGGLIAKIVDSDKVDVGTLLLGCTEEVSANTAEAVDSDADGHVGSFEKMMMRDLKTDPLMPTTCRPNGRAPKGYLVRFYFSTSR